MRRAALVLVGAMVIALVACSKATTECDCEDDALILDVPEADSPDVSDVRLSGNACAGVTPACVNQTHGCSQYRFEAIAAGTCHVDVFFASGGTFSADVSIGESTGCCTGFYASPPESREIAVEYPADDAGHS